MTVRKEQVAMVLSELLEKIIFQMFFICNTEQPISEAVITVPPYFNQAERRAMLRAADLAGLKVLQLINDNTAG